MSACISEEYGSRLEAEKITSTTLSPPFLFDTLICMLQTTTTVEGGVAEEKQGIDSKIGNFHACSIEIRLKKVIFSTDGAELRSFHSELFYIYSSYTNPGLLRGFRGAGKIS